MEKAKKTKTKKVTKTTPQKTFESFPGMVDILPREAHLWRDITQTLFTTADIHAFYRIHTSFVERRQIFSCYEAEFGKRLDDTVFSLHKGGGVVRPEGSISILRAYAEHHLGHFSSPLKVFYFFETVHRGEKREIFNHHELGFHVLGDTEPFYDIQVISAAIDFLRALKIKDACIRVNANGCRHCRATYREKVKKYLATRRGEFRATDYKTLEKKPEALFTEFSLKYSVIADEAPTLLDYLCQNCNNHFKALLELLEDNNIPYEPDPRLLRSSERWNRVVFDVVAGEKKVPLFSGGRYDHLAEVIGGRQIPAVGVSCIVGNLIHYLRESDIHPSARQRMKVFFIVVGDKAKKASVRHMNELRSNGIIVEEALGKQSFKAQIKIGEKSRAALVLIVGQKEAFENTVIIRHLESGAQETITGENLVEEVKRRLKS